MRRQRQTRVLGLLSVAGRKLKTPNLRQNEMTDVIRAFKRGRELSREGMEFSRVMTVAKSMPEHEALVAGYLGEKRRVADLDKWAARYTPRSEFES